MTIQLRERENNSKMRELHGEKKPGEEAERINRYKGAP